MGAPAAAVISRAVSGSQGDAAGVQAPGAAFHGAASNLTACRREHPTLTALSELHDTAILKIVCCFYVCPFAAYALSRAAVALLPWHMESRHA